MRGIETAFWGTLGRDPELKTSRAGNAYASLNVAVTVGKDDTSGKDVTQWVRVTAFGETAERIAAQAEKGARVYVEGSLTLNHWQAADGEKRTDLQVAGFKVEKVGAIGKNRPKREDGEAREPARQSYSDDAPLSDEIPF